MLLLEVVWMDKLLFGISLLLITESLLVRNHLVMINLVETEMISTPQLPKLMTNNNRLSKWNIFLSQVSLLHIKTLSEILFSFLLQLTLIRELQVMVNILILLVFLKTELSTYGIQDQFLKNNFNYIMITLGSHINNWFYINKMVLVSLVFLEH